jgi:hypothetical protein
MYDREPDYRPTEFACEGCGSPLHRVWPSTLLVCVEIFCTCNEPLFLVVTDD